MIAIYANQTDKSDVINIESQIELCLGECTGAYTPFIDGGDEKESDRPAFRRLIKAVERGEIKRIIVYRLDCIVHSLTEFGHMWDVLAANSTEFCAVSENFDTATPLGRATVAVIMDFAHIERESIAQRIRDNYRERAKRGIYPGGPAPYGFDIGHTTVDGKPASMLVPNDKIDVVKEIFELYSAGNISLGKLALYLHERGISGINRTGWDNVSISRILHNPVYVKADRAVYDYFRQKGTVIYNDPGQFTGEKGCWLLGKRTKWADGPAQQGSELLIVACHDGVVSSPVFLRCQQRLDANKRLKNTGNGAYTWLSGLVKCGYCGYSMQAVSANGGRYVYLICTGKTNFKVCNAHFKSPHVDVVEPIVAAKIDERLHELKSVRRGEGKGDAEIEELKARLHNLETEISNLLGDLADAEDVPSHYIKRRISELDTQKREIVDSIKNRLERRRSIVFPDSDFSLLPFEQKKSLAHALIDKVCLREGLVDIEWAKL